MRGVAKEDVADGVRISDGSSSTLLGSKRERRLLTELADCKRVLVDALAQHPCRVAPDDAADPKVLSRFIADVNRTDGPMEGAHTSVFRRYFQIRGELALANMRLVAFVAKRYRNRGVAYSDLYQEGFCGLLEAIDRFDLAHETKLSTYATWWIRQAVQSAVAACAYPVRLTPRHLRQLARSQDEQDGADMEDGSQARLTPESLQRIQAATRPVVSLRETGLAAVPRASAPETVAVDDIDVDAALGKWMVSLRPRQRQVLSYRFGLGGAPRLSLSQVGKILAVSKERVRQIENSALQAIRSSVSAREPCFDNITSLLCDSRTG